MSTQTPCSAMSRRRRVIRIGPGPSALEQMRDRGRIGHTVGAHEGHLLREGDQSMQNAVPGSTAGFTDHSTAPSVTDFEIDTEWALVEVLAELLDRDQVSVDEHFFDDLGADSMVMARFCARIRKRDDLPSVAMKDIYEYPTVKGLASALATPPAPSVETVVAEVLGEVVGVDKVS